MGEVEVLERPKELKGEFDDDGFIQILLNLDDISDDDEVPY